MAWGCRIFLSKGGRALCGTSQESKEEKNITQVALSEKSGIEATYVSDLENAKRELCLRVIDMLVIGLGVSMGDMLNEYPRLKIIS